MTENVHCEEPYLVVVPTVNSRFMALVYKSKAKDERLTAVELYIIVITCSTAMTVFLLPLG